MEELHALASSGFRSGKVFFFTWLCILLGLQRVMVLFSSILPPLFHASPSFKKQQQLFCCYLLRNVSVTLRESSLDFHVLTRLLDRRSL